MNEGKRLLRQANTWRFLWICIWVAFSQASYSQTKPKKFHIQKVEIKDSIDHHIRYFIDSVGNRYEEFRNGLGYLRLTIEEISDKGARDRDIVRKYTLYHTTLTYDDEEYARYPLFYTISEGRPMVIRIENVDPGQYFADKISKRSKRKFKRLIEPFLYPRERVPDEIRKRGKRPYGRRWWRSTGFYVCHCYFEINVFRDGTSESKRVEEYY